MAQQSIRGFGRESRHATARAGGGLLDEGAREFEHVVATLAQRGQADLDHAQTVEQILAKLPLLDRAHEFTVGGGENPDVDCSVRRFTDTADASLLECPQ